MTALLIGETSWGGLSPPGPFSLWGFPFGDPGGQRDPPSPSGHPTAPVREGTPGGVVVTLGVALRWPQPGLSPSLRASVSPKGGHRGTRHSGIVTVSPNGAGRSLCPGHRVPGGAGSAPGAGVTSCDTARVTPATASSPSPAGSASRKDPGNPQKEGEPQKGGGTPPPPPPASLSPSPGGSPLSLSPSPATPGPPRGFPGSPPVPTAAVSAGVGKAPSPGGGGGAVPQFPTEL